MPIVVAKPLKRIHVEISHGDYLQLSDRGPKFLVDIKKIETNYAQIVAYPGIKIRSFLSRIFNEQGELVSEPHMNRILRVLEIRLSGEKTEHFLDLTELAHTLSIPEDYTVEILAINFLIGKEERPIFPNETKIDCWRKEVEVQIEKEMEILREIGEAFEVVGYLQEIGLSEIASVLAEGHVKFEKGDYDGCIKSYRKVVEGFRNYIKDKSINTSKGRAQAIRGYINKSYSLLSNFGEHYGTKAFVEEGIFARDLVTALSKYMAKKLRGTP